MDEQRIRQIIREELSSLIRSDRYTFHKLIQILDGRNIQLGVTTGTKIGTATTQRLGFFGTTPAVQPLAPVTRTQATISGTGDDADITANFSSLNSWADDIEQALADLGLTA